VKIALPSKVVKVATGKCHTLLVLENGELYGCGANNYGQLGLGEGTKASQDSLVFKKIPTVTSVRDAACGADYSLFCTQDGQLFSCGHPEHGQLGLGSNGEYIKEAKRGIQYAFVTKPQQVRMFCTKDSKTGMNLLLFIIRYRNSIADIFIIIIRIYYGGR
jgi:alpha-tubulin suppressor-like RCC1 family protein